MTAKRMTRAEAVSQQEVKFFCENCGGVIGSHRYDPFCWWCVPEKDYTEAPPQKVCTCCGKRHYQEGRDCLKCHECDGTCDPA